MAGGWRRVAMRILRRQYALALRRIAADSALRAAEEIVEMSAASFKAACNKAVKAGVPADRLARAKAVFAALAPLREAMHGEDAAGASTAAWEEAARELLGDTHPAVKTAGQILTWRKAVSALALAMGGTDPEEIERCCLAVEAAAAAVGASEESGARVAAARARAAQKRARAPSWPSWSRSRRRSSRRPDREPPEAGEASRESVGAA